MIPSLALSIVVTSDSTASFIETDYHCTLQTVVADGFIRLRSAMRRSAQIPSPPITAVTSWRAFLLKKQTVMST